MFSVGEAIEIDNSNGFYHLVFFIILNCNLKNNPELKEFMTWTDIISGCETNNNKTGFQQLSANGK